MIVRKRTKSEANEVVKVMHLNDEKVMNKSLGIYEQVVNKLWTSWEQILNKKWISHGRVMEIG